LRFAVNGNALKVCIGEDISKVPSCIVEWKMIAASDVAFLDERI
jgi:hypothetical protein